MKKIFKNSIIALQEKGGMGNSRVSISFSTEMSAKFPYLAHN
nr:hypothetical protein [Leptospira ilyithenensis]